MAVVEMNADKHMSRSLGDERTLPYLADQIVLPKNVSSQKRISVTRRPALLRASMNGANESSEGPNA